MQPGPFGASSSRAVGRQLGLVTSKLLNLDAARAASASAEAASGLVMLHMPLALVRCIKEAESQLVKQP
jgi:hypothetical protein